MCLSRLQSPVLSSISLVSPTFTLVLVLAVTLRQYRFQHKGRHFRQAKQSLFKPSRQPWRRPSFAIASWQLKNKAISTASHLHNRFSAQLANAVLPSSGWCHQAAPPADATGASSAFSAIQWRCNLCQAASFLVITAYWGSTQIDSQSDRQWLFLSFSIPLSACVALPCQPSQSASITALPLLAKMSSAVRSCQHRRTISIVYTSPSISIHISEQCVSASN